MPHRIFREDSCIQAPRHAADPQKTETVTGSDKKNLCELCGIFTGKIFKIYFSNAFSTENYYLNHSTSAKFFSYLVQELMGFPAGIPTDDIRRSPAPKITLYYSADPGFQLEPVTGNYLSGSPHPSRVADLSRVR